MMSLRFIAIQGLLRTIPNDSNLTYSKNHSYKVNTLSNSPKLNSNEITVERRFSDFTWLQDQLSNSFPGIILPALPEKQSVGRLNPDFIEIRRRSLEKYINKVAKYNDFVDFHQFIAFLSADEFSFASIKEASKKESKANSVISLIQNTVFSLSVTVSKVISEKTPTDTKLDEIFQYLTFLETHLNNIFKHASLLVKRYQEESVILSELNKSVANLALCEEKYLAGALIKIGETTQNMSSDHMELANTSQLHFIGPLHDLIRYVGSAKSALQKRHSCRQTQSSALAALESSQSILSKTVTGGSLKDEQLLQQRKMTVEKLKVEAAAATAELEAATTRVMAEIVRFKVEMAAEMRDILLSFVNLQIDFNSKLNSSWMSLVPTLQSVDTSTNSSSNGKSSLTSMMLTASATHNNNNSNNNNGIKNNNKRNNDNTNGSINESQQVVKVTAVSSNVPPDHQDIIF